MSSSRDDSGDASFERTCISHANDTQVAGTHYRSEYQHWDLVADTGMGYFQGQVTKYVTRHASKNGLQDLQKAAHFLQKLIELASERGWVCWNRAMMHDQQVRYHDSNKLGRAEMHIISRVVRWEDADHLQTTALLLGELMHARYVTVGASAPIRLLDSDPDGPDYGKAE